MFLCERVLKILLRILFNCVFAKMESSIRKKLLSCRTIERIISVILDLMVLFSLNKGLSA